MKLAVFADIHANYTALQAVSAHIDAWGPDAVIFLGDLVTRGPRPSECLHYLQKRQQSDGWLVIRGNHEDYVISKAHPDAPRQGPEFDIFQPTHWAYQKLGGNIAGLEAMPFQHSLLAPDGSEIRAVHASMRSNSEGIYPETSDTELAEKIATPSETQASAPPALLCVGHTHRPLIRQLNGTVVVNAGSAGLPFDGDRRASYAQATWGNGLWQVEIVRVEYDLQKAEQDFFESGYFPEAGPLVELVLVELRTAWPQLGSWARQYQAQVMAGEISMQDSVRLFLEATGGSGSIGMPG